MLRTLCALALGLCIFTPALADPPEGEPTASVGSLGLELIADANAEGVFELVPAEHTIVVRHARSGLVCRMDPDSGNRLVIFPQAARGEDVACDSNDGNASVTLYATRFSFAEPVALDDLAEAAAAAIAQRYPGARELPPPPQSSGDGLPASRTAQFMVAREGDDAPMYTRATVALVGDWAIKLRYTALAHDAAAAHAAEQTANAIWRATLSEMLRPQT